MIAAPTPQLSQRLRDLRTNCPECESLAVVSVEGVMLASCLGDGADDDQLAAMSAALVGFGDRITRELGCGTLDHAVLRGKTGFVALMSLDESSALISVLREDANLGLALLDLRRTARDLQALDLEPITERMEA